MEKRHRASAMQQQQQQQQQLRRRLCSHGRGRVLNDVGDGQTDRLATAPAATATAAKESNAYVRTRDNGGGAADIHRRRLVSRSRSVAAYGRRRCRCNRFVSQRDVCRRSPNVRACVRVLCSVRAGGGVCARAFARRIVYTGCFFSNLIFTVCDKFFSVSSTIGNNIVVVVIIIGRV